jgi:hypothetical protein
MPTKSQTNLAPSQRARDNEFPSQLFFVVVVADIAIAIAIVAVASHALHFTAVSCETLQTNW